MLKVSKRKFMTAAVALTGSCSAWSDSYVITDLGARQNPVAVNKTGAVASNFKALRGDIYRDEKWKKLGRHTEVFAINDNADVVGENYKYRYPVLWSRNANQTQLPVPIGGTGGIAYGINDAKTVVGSYSLNSVPQCFTWTSSQGSMDLAPGQYYYCSAAGVSNSGNITGTAATTQGGARSAFVFNEEALTFIGTLLGTTQSQGIAINDSGEIVGVSLGANQLPRGFTWDGSSLIDWDAAHTYSQVMPLAINESGDGVGWAGSDPENSTAVRFSHGKLTRLQDEIVGGQGWELDAATGINSKGVIVGSGLLNGAAHGFMLTPQH